MIKQLLERELVINALQATEKKAAIEEMVDTLERAGKLKDRAAFQEAVFKREEEYSTGIGMGIAIPHGKSDGVKEPALVFAKSEAGVDFDSMDEKPAHLLFLVAVPEKASDDHLKVLSLLSRKLMHAELREKLMQADGYDAVIDLLAE